ncbi:MAG: tRNA (adenosine(37)-N6)-threonylcarbamoyltransferase complex dimerization subunit type 1 TsaB [Rhodocyclaceae bacterium]
MKILAFEASTRRLSVALWCAGALLEKSADVPNGGAERLLPWAEELIGAAGISLAQLDGIAFGAGPGGFTGLRLACGVSQGLAFGLDCPVVPVGTLAALALASGDGKVIVCLDARMNEVYVAAYGVAGEQVEEIMAVKVGAGETAPLPEGADWRGVGDGFVPWGDVLTARLGARLVSIDATVSPTASAVARLAAPRLASGQGVAAAAALPFYIRDKVAFTTAERRARGGLR